MKKYFVVSDIHSFYNEMIDALNEAGFEYDNSDHIFVSCGDLFDRGPDAIECLRFVNDLSDDRKILIKGNHESLLMDVLDRGYFESYDIHNRTDDTINQFVSLLNKEYYGNYELCKALKENREIRKYYDSLKNYYELDEYIFVHGYIPCVNKYIKYEYKPDWRESSDEEFVDAAWLNGFELYAQGIKEENKTIVCGHIHTSYAHHYLHHDGSEFGDNMNSNIFYDDGIIGIDACTAYTRRVNVLTIEK